MCRSDGPVYWTCFSNVDIRWNPPPFSFCSTLSSFLTFHFRCLELCVRCCTCGTRGLTKWSLCGPEPRSCLFGLANEHCCTNDWISRSHFAHNNAAEELPFSPVVSACVHYSCALIHLHENTHTLFQQPVIALKAHETDTKTNQNVAYCIVCPCISHTQTYLQTTHFFVNEAHHTSPQVWPNTH